ncbi:MAG: cellulose binding domain-containing protein, partial [Balneolaceae bacterium]
MFYRFQIYSRVLYAILLVIGWIVFPLHTAEAQDLRLQYKANSTNSTSQTIDPFTNLYNDGGSAVDLEDVTIRYWFTSEPPGLDVYEIFWAQIGAGNIFGNFGTIGGERYLEIGFTSGAGSLAASSSTGEMQNRIRDDGWGNYNQSNDFSFDASKTSYSDHESITVYYQGSLVWGTPPAGTTEAESMEITQEPTTTTAGQAISPAPTVLLEDALGNPVEGVDVTVSLNQNSFTGGSTTIVTTNASGEAVFDNLTLNTAASGYELTFDADASQVGNETSASFTVNSAAPQSMSVTSSPSQTAAGSTLSPSPSVTLVDAFSNPVQGEDITVSLNKNSFSSGTTTVSTNSSGVASFSNLVITQAATNYVITFDAAASGVDNKNSSSFTIVAAPAASMSITQQPQESVVSGVIAGPPAVTLTDTYGNAVPGVDVTVSETGNSYTFDEGTLTRTTNSSGVATFNDLEIQTGDTGYRLTFDADASGVSNVNSNFFDVVAPTGSMTITAQPTETSAGDVVSPSPSVTLLDGAEDPISGVDITVSLNQGSFASGTLTVQTNGSGVATFSDLVIESAAEGYEITFNADQSGVANVFSNAFEVVAANPASMSMDTQPSNTVAGSSLSGPPSVLLVDSFENPVSGVDITVSLNQNSFASGTTTVSTDSEGLATYSNLVITAAATGYQLTFNADAAGVSNIQSGSYNITAAAIDEISISVQPGESTADVTISPAPTILVEDSYGNPKQGVDVSVSLNKSSFTGGSTIIVTSNSNGNAVFNNLRINTADTGYEMTFSATGASPVTSNSFEIVQPDPSYGSIRVQYDNDNTNTTTAELRPYMRVYNDSDLDINLSDITVRYWFTSEPEGLDVHEVEYAEMGSEDDITGSFGTLGGMRYLQVGFSPDAVLPVGLGGDGSTPNLFPSSSSTGIIQQRIRDDGWGNYTQSDDYSFDASVTTFEDYDEITVYYKGQLVWGTPPAGTTEAESMEI